MEISEPVPTRIFELRADFHPEADSVYLFGVSAEGRSHLPQDWQSAQACKFVEITESEGLHFTVSGNGAEIPLRSDAALSSFLDPYRSRKVYLDVTGLSHHVWAPILRSAILSGLTVDAVYVEPAAYRFSDVPRPGEIFDLSTRIEGISPLPGFTRLSRSFDESPVFVPMLGFEGARFHYVSGAVQPEGNMTIPVIGLPGFRPEYPFYTYEGNQPALQIGQAWRDARFAAGNCPFEAYFALKTVADEHSDHHLAVAPIGTKPHAVGAVLFALTNADRTELIYDHPVRSAGRTEGEFRTLVYSVSEFYLGMVA
jgi:hypothetical protein